MRNTGKCRKLRETSAIFIIMVLLITMLAGCSFKDINSKNETIKLTKSQQSFGTIMTITLYGSDKAHIEELEDKAFEEIIRLEKIFSARREDSELSYVNANAYNSPVPVSDELYYVMSEALKYNRSSSGALDISIGKLVDMWAIGTDNERVPSKEELEKVSGMHGCQYIELDDGNKTVHFLSDKVKLDLGAVAKGYAADVIKSYILKLDSGSYGILNFGGNVCTIGEKENGDAWVIGITDPFNTSSAYFSLNIKDECVVTSGNYERYFEKDGIRYHHILDSMTGYPAQKGIVSASIIGANSLECDALSTACYILGVENGLALIDSIPSVEAVFIDENGKCHTSDGIDKYSIKFMSE